MAMNIIKASATGNFDEVIVLIDEYLEWNMKEKFQTSPPL